MVTSRLQVVVMVLSLLLLLFAQIAAGYQSSPQHDAQGQQPVDATTFGSRRKVLDVLAHSSLLMAPQLAVLKDPNPSYALSPKEAATSYDSFASSYDDLDGGQAASLLGIDQARSQLLKKARGNVLEIGVGTGLNFEKYDPSQIASFTFVDISDGMLQEAKKRFASDDNLLRNIPVKFVKADATSELVQLFGTQSFDTVVDTFSLCVFGNDGARNSLNQMRQVVKDSNAGGRVLLLENSRSSNPLLGLYQDATAEAAASVGGKGCVYNQDVGRLIRESGMVVTEQDEFAAGLFQAYECTVPVTAA